jgi:hypothetical protein
VDPAVNAYLLGLPSWQSFSPEQVSADTIAGNTRGTQEFADGTEYSCQTTEYNIVETPDKVVTFDPDANIMWLGALLEGDGYRGGIGSLREWTVRERAPIDVSIDLLAGQNTRRVTNPTLASVNAAVASLIQSAEDRNHKGGSSISFSQENTYSLTQGMLALGITARLAKKSVTAKFSFARTASERTVTAYFVQRMFTVSMVMPNEPGDLFSEAFTQARLQEEQARGRVGPSNLPVYVASITYGRILMVSITSSATITDIRASLAASFGGVVGGSISGRYLDILNSSKIDVVALGGEGQNATALIQSGQLKDYFAVQPALTSARPISYVVRNVGDNSIARVSETSRYDLRECTALPVTGTMRIDVTPNDATVNVVGPNSYTTGPQTGDQDLEDLVPGGYTISVSRVGFDSLSRDTTIEAGQHIDFVAAMQPVGPNPTGAYYTVTPRRLEIQDAGCTGESQPDVYYTISVNNVPVASVAQSASITVDEGGSLTITGSFADTIRTGIAVVASVSDDDGFANAADPMGSMNYIRTWPHIPTGTNLYVTMTNVSGCRVRLYFDIVKGVTVTTTPPVPVAPPVTEDGPAVSVAARRRA